MHRSWRAEDTRRSQVAAAKRTDVLTDVMTNANIIDMENATIRALRENLVLSQEALARKLGVAVRTVARWESGDSKPSPLAIEKINQILLSGAPEAILAKEK